MEAETEPATAATNQSIEKGIYLTPFNKLVHACKVRDDLGAGITRCGLKFLIGAKMYIPDATFGAPTKTGDSKTFSTCELCNAATGYSAVVAKWRDWKYIVRRTLKMIGRIKA